MNKSPILAAVVSLASVIAEAPLCFAQADSPTDSRNVNNNFLYHDGFIVGMHFTQYILTLTLNDDDGKPPLQHHPKSSKEDVTSMRDEQLMEWLQSSIDTILQESAAAALEKGKSFRAKFAKQKGVTTMKSGLMYRILAKGNGRTYDWAMDGEEAIVSVSFEGKMIDGTVFDKEETPIRMGINQAVPGFIEALKSMPIGSEWEICLPADLAYGELAPAPIEAHSTIVFTLKLHDITTLAPPPSCSTPMRRTPKRLQQHQVQDRVEAGSPTRTE